MEGNNYSNACFLIDTPVLLYMRPPHTHTHHTPHTHKKYMYVITAILIVVMIKRMNDFSIVNLVHITVIGITRYNTKYNIQYLNAVVFHISR